jgi:hypothetical protein
MRLDGVMFMDSARASQMAREVAAVHSGQADVEQRYLGMKGVDQLERPRPVVRDAHLGPARLGGVAAGEALFHVAGVAEVHVTLWLLLGSPPPILTSFVLEAANRIVNVIFRFVPIRLGVDEAGTALVTQIIGLGAAPGVTLALVRKARVLVWAGLGAALMLRRGIAIPKYEA